MKVVRFAPDTADAPSLAEASAELAMEMSRIAREGGRTLLEYLDELLTAHQVAAELGVEVQSVYRWASKGYGPRRVKLGRGEKAVRYRRGDVRAWLDQQSIEPARVLRRRRASSRIATRHQAAAAEGIAS
jgi:predicted DNA-binding transcriptional regulator AlpA